MVNNKCSIAEILPYLSDNDKVKIKEAQEKLQMEEKLNLINTYHHNKIYQQKDGRWATYVCISSKRKERKKFCKKNKEDLIDTLIEFFEDRKIDPTFEECFNLWLKEKLRYKEISRATYDRYICTFKRFLANTNFSQEKVQDITSQNLEKIIKCSIADFNLTKKAFAGLRLILMGTLKYAKKNEYTDFSVTIFFQELDLPKRIFTHKIVDLKKEVFQEDELPIIMNYLRENLTIENLAIQLAFFTGVRIGELSTCKFSDIENKTLYIHQTESKHIDPETNKTIIVIKDFPKSESGVRYVILTNEAMDIISQIKLFNPDGDYLFEKNGERIFGYNINKHLYRACDLLNIRRRSTHKIRKTYASRLINAGTDRSLITTQLGHSQFNTTLTHYYIPNQSSDKKRSQIEHALSS